MAVANIAAPEFSLRFGQCFGPADGQQVPVKSDHQPSSGLIVYRPQTCQHVLASGAEKCSRQPDKLISTRRFREVALPQAGLAGTERDQAGM